MNYEANAAFNALRDVKAWGWDRDRCLWIIDNGEGRWWRPVSSDDWVAVGPLRHGSEWIEIYMSRVAVPGWFVSNQVAEARYEQSS